MDKEKFREYSETFFAQSHSIAQEHVEGSDNCFDEVQVYDALGICTADTAILGRIVSRVKLLGNHARSGYENCSEEDIEKLSYQLAENAMMLAAWVKDHFENRKKGREEC